MLHRTRILKSGEKRVSHYYNATRGGKRVEIPLGKCLATAKIKWVELEGHHYHDTEPPPVVSMGYVFDRFEREIVPKKKPRTHKGPTFLS